MRITLVQPDIAWEDIDTNLASYESRLGIIGGETDAVVLPELFTTGFTMRSRELAEPMEGPTMNWMQKMAAGLSCDIAGSIIIREKGSYYNRLIWMHMDGNYDFYDKRHLFRMSGENNSYTRGEESLILESHGMRIKPLICYDLRFPVWSRNQNDYDVLVYIANWPAPRKEVWNSLLKARAIENQAYVLGVNRIGEDGMGILYNGDTQVMDPKGQELLRLIAEKEGLKTVHLSLNELIRFREKFPVWKDSDPFSFEV